MPRPTSKDQLNDAMNQEHAKLEAYLKSLSAPQMNEPGVVGDWSVKDVLAHLTAWEQMCLEWINAGKEGRAIPIPAAGFTWREIPALNQHIYETYRECPLEDILSAFHASFAQIQQAVQGFSNEELFTPKVYKWTNTTTLGSYLTSATSSHYAWALKEIRKGTRQK